jgi:conserved oligomeric Golgi complex subunit 3
MCAQPVIFEDMAHEAVSMCRQSLAAAGDMLKTRNPPTSHMDAQLFLVRHLLILKEITQNLDLGQWDANSSTVTGGFACLTSKRLFD